MAHKKTIQYQGDVQEGILNQTTRQILMEGLQQQNMMLGSTLSTQNKWGEAIAGMSSPLHSGTLCHKDNGLCWDMVTAG